jgi:hypothetical protein
MTSDARIARWCGQRGCYFKPERRLAACWGLPSNACLEACCFPVRLTVGQMTLEPMFRYHSLVVREYEMMQGSQVPSSRYRLLQMLPGNATLPVCRG